MELKSFFLYPFLTDFLVNTTWQYADCLTSPVMRKLFPACTKIFTATACFWSNLLCEQLHDRWNVYVLSKCNQAKPSVAGFGDLVYNTHVISSRKVCTVLPHHGAVISCSPFIFSQCLSELSNCASPCWSPVWWKLYCVYLCRALWIRCAHWRQPQTLVVRGESFSLPGLVSDTIMLNFFLVINSFYRRDKLSKWWREMLFNSITLYLTVYSTNSHHNLPHDT